jgi:D-tyrosyl-tRNA(Tyr) deacylase
LYGDTREGRRPSFTEAAGAELGNALYTQFMQMLRQKGLNVQAGVFGAHMAVELINDGPVTILIDSSKLF